MRNKSRRHLTLIEVIIALGIASVLLGVFFPYMLDTIRLKKKIEKEKESVFAKAYVQQRLATLFSSLDEEAPFQILKHSKQPKKLCFTFDNGYDYDPAFQDWVIGSLFLEKETLIFEMQKQGATKKEPLLGKVKDIQFECMYLVGNTFMESDEIRATESPPAFFILRVTFIDEKEDSFYFRLQSPIIGNAKHEFFTSSSHFYHAFRSSFFLAFQAPRIRCYRG